MERCTFVVLPRALDDSTKEKPKFIIEAYATVYYRGMFVSMTVTPRWVSKFCTANSARKLVECRTKFSLFIWREYGEANNKRIRFSEDSSASIANLIIEAAEVIAEFDLETLLGGLKIDTSTPPRLESTPQTSPVPQTSSAPQTQSPPQTPTVPQIGSPPKNVIYTVPDNMPKDLPILTPWNNKIVPQIRALPKDVGYAVPKNMPRNLPILTPWVDPKGTPEPATKLPMITIRRKFTYWQPEEPEKKSEPKAEIPSKKKKDNKRRNRKKSKKHLKTSEEDKTDA